MEEKGCLTQEKKSLMNSIAKLKKTVEMLNEVAYASDRMVAVMRRTEIQQGEKKEPLQAPMPPQDIIDLINSINGSLMVKGDEIMSNIQTVSSMIE